MNYRRALVAMSPPVLNPDDAPLRHTRVREESGMRAGGFGLLHTTKLVDELVYNEQHNEVLFVKYLP